MLQDGRSISTSSYNPKTGALFYDADGSGSGAAIHFATLADHPAHLSEVGFAVI